MPTMPGVPQTRVRCDGREWGPKSQGGAPMHTRHVQGYHHTQRQHPVGEMDVEAQETEALPVAEPVVAVDESSADEEDLPCSADGIKRRPHKPFHPDYYYPLDKPASQHNDGVPVFEPTMEEFQDFYEFVKKIDKYGMRAGVVKIVPPKEWRNALPSVSEPLKETRITAPIAEHFLGSVGLFRQTNVTKSRIYNPKQWREMAESDRYNAPDFFNRCAKETPTKRATKGAGSTRKRKTKVEQEVASEVGDGQPDPGHEATPPLVDNSSTPSDSNDMPMTPQAENADTPLVAVAGGPTADDAFPLVGSAKQEAEEQPQLQEAEMAPAAPASTPAPKPKKPRKPAGNPRGYITKEEWATFNWTDLANGAKVEDFTVDACKEIERRYWRTLTFGEPPMYGADMQGSLFTEETKNWNVANLDDLLQRLAPHRKIPGVNTPYLYFGTWRATFAWHVEDVDLYSINYVHFGAPKFWYSIPQEQSERFERVMAGFFPQDRQKCAEFLRHKVFVASPQKLADQGIYLNKCVQLPGEFMLTYPRGYHSGFNVGYNCAESINFATETWLDLGRKANACACNAEQDSVKIDIDRLLYEAANPSERIYEPAPAPVRKRMYNNENRIAAAIKRQYDEISEEQKAARKAERAEKQRQAQAALQAAIARQNSYVCVLCPDTTRDTLVKLAEAPNATAAKDPKRRAGYAHKICVMFTPATWIQKNKHGEERVYGFENIEKARWSLKCQLCPEKYGSKVQCTKNAKCVRACHVTCALQEGSGVIIDAVLGEGEHQVSLIEGARREGGNPLDIFETEAAHAHPIVKPGETAPMSPTRSTFPGADGEAGGVVPDAPVDDAVAENEAKDAVYPEENLPNGTGEPMLDDPTGSIQLVVVCRQHNPEWAKLQSQRKNEEIKEKIDKMGAGAPLRIRTSSGVFETQLLRHLPRANSIVVKFADGKEQPYSYGAILWATAAPATQQRKPASTPDDYIYDGPRPAQRSRTERADRSAAAQATATLPPAPPPVYQHPLPSLSQPQSLQAAAGYPTQPSFAQPPPFASPFNQMPTAAAVAPSPYQIPPVQSWASSIPPQ